MLRQGEPGSRQKEFLNLLLRYDGMVGKAFLYKIEIPKEKLPRFRKCDSEFPAIIISFRKLDFLLINYMYFYF